MAFAVTLLGIAMSFFGGVGYINRHTLHFGFQFFMVMCAGVLVAITGVLWLISRRSQRPIVARLFRGYCKTLLCLLILFALSFVAIECFIVLNSGMASDEELGSADTAILLGAGLYDDRPSEIYMTRLEAAYEFMAARPQLTMVLCGGQGDGETITEAEAARRYLTGRGIDDERLICEDTSSDTAENIQNALLELPNMKKAVIITNDFHIARSSMLAERYGIEPVKYPVETPDFFLRIGFYVREYFSMVIFGIESVGVQIDTSFLGV